MADEFDTVMEQQQNEEQAHFYWTLAEFGDLIRRYGAYEVFKQLDKDVIEAIVKELE
jgi:hypothetical protein